MIYYGVVEDIFDKEKLGRVKVRIHGLHSYSKEDIPIADLPNCLVMGPTTSPGISGLGHSSYIVQGSWVVLVAINSEEQDFLIIGSLPSESAASFGNPNEGYKDPEGLMPREFGVPDNNPRVRGEDDPDGSGEQGEYQPPSAYAPKYPYNHVYETTCGHVKEYDDTPGSQRIREKHMSGTYYEIQPEGTKIQRVVNDKYELILGDDTLEVKGNVNIIISEDANIAVAGNVTAHVGENVDFHVEGDVTGEVNGNVSMRVGPNKPAHITVDDDGNQIHEGAPAGYTKKQAIDIWNPPVNIEITTEISGGDMVSSGSKLIMSEDAEGDQRQWFVSMMISTAPDGKTGDAKVDFTDQTYDVSEDKMNFESDFYFIMGASMSILSQIASAFDAEDYTTLKRVAEENAIDGFGVPVPIVHGFKETDIKLIDNNWVYKEETLAASFGHIDLHIEGNINALIDGHADLTVLQSAKIDVKRDVDLDVGGNVDALIVGNMDMEVQGNMDTQVGGTYKLNSDGAMTITAPQIDIN